MTAVRVCGLDELAENEAKRFDVDGHRVAVVRFDGDELFAIGDKCSHADYSLAEGEVDSGERTIECWKHGSTFSLETGVPDCLPATKPVSVYDVTINDGDVFVAPRSAS